MQLLFFALITLLYAAPVDYDDEDELKIRVKSTKKPDTFIDIVESEQEHKQDGSYSWSYRGEDGSFREETAVVVNPGSEDQYLEVSGSYSFFDSEGKEVVVHYKADKNGFVPAGSNIPEEISNSAKNGANLPKVNENKKPKMLEEQHLNE